MLACVVHASLKVPRRCRSALPLEAQYSTSSSDYYIGKGFTRFADFEMVRLEGGENEVRKLEVCLAALYDNDRCDYYDHIRAWRKGPNGDCVSQFPNFISFPRWLGRADGVPGGGTFRNVFENAQYAKGSAGPESSLHEYRTRQIQSVSVIGSDCYISTDHTFQGAKNFAISEATAIWNCITGWLRVVILVLCRGTGVRELIHAIECAMHRHKFGPLMHTTDTWPANRTLFETQWVGTIGRLGLFHWMKRILDSLNPGHEKLSAARKALRTRIIAEDQAFISNHTPS